MLEPLSPDENPNELFPALPYYLKFAVTLDLPKILTENLKLLQY
jgi:hypothetical protein